MTLPRGEAEGAAPRSPVIPGRFSNRREDPPDERYRGTTSLAPRIYEGGGPRSGRGSPPAAAGKASSVTASPCQLPQRGSQGHFAPFLPPAFMRGRATKWQGESSAAAGKASSVTALPCRLPQRGSRGRYAPFLPPAFMRGEGHAVAGGVPPPRRGKPPQSRLRRASSPKGEAEGASHRSCTPHL